MAYPVNHNVINLSLLITKVLIFIFENVVGRIYAQITYTLR